MPDPGNADPLEAALDELYGVDPSDFVETRKRLAAERRGAGDKDAAKSLLAARRPTTAAWALNRLSRTQPEVVDRFLERSRDLEAALVRARSGGREAMRDATREQRQALSDVTEAALAGLGDKATDGFRNQIVATLQAAGADDSVREQLRQGRLIREQSGSTGFPDGPNLTLVPDLEPQPEPPARPAPAVKPRKQAPPKHEQQEHDQQEREKRARSEKTAQRRAELEREASEQAQRRIEDAEAAAEVAQRAAEAAEAAAVVARARVVQLHDDLEQARREVRTADDTAARTRRDATRLARAATKLRSKA